MLIARFSISILFCFLKIFSHNLHLYFNKYTYNHEFAEHIFKCQTFEIYLKLKFFISVLSQYLEFRYLKKDIYIYIYIYIHDITEIVQNNFFKWVEKKSWKQGVQNISCFQSCQNSVIQYFIYFTSGYMSHTVRH